jgi:hypothetical protein
MVSSGLWLRRGITSALAVLYACQTLPAGAQNLEQSWWLKFKQQTTSSKPPVAATTTVAVPDDTNSQPSYFTVPAWFGAPPKPYERPTELFRSPSTTFDTTSTATTSSYLGMPLLGSYGPLGWGGYSPWLGRGLLPYAGGYAGLGIGNLLPYGSPYTGFSPGAFMGLSAVPSALPFAGYGWGTPGILGFGYGGWGSPFFGSPGSSALMMGAFGGRNNSSHLGEWTPPRVMQTAPSKASGNYFAPSTQDTSASGSYYASSTPAQMPMVPVRKPTTNFWGPSGNPFGNP